MVKPGLGAFGIAIALKERGAARWAFFGWALHQGLIALTPVGYGGWQPWVIRNVILLFSATLLIVAGSPISPRAQRIGIAVLVVAVSFAWVTKWSARQLFLKTNVELAFAAKHFAERHECGLRQSSL